MKKTDNDFVKSGMKFTMENKKVLPENGPKEKIRTNGWGKRKGVPNRITYEKQAFRDPPSASPLAIEDLMLLAWQRGKAVFYHSGLKRKFLVIPLPDDTTAETGTTRAENVGAMA